MTPRAYTDEQLEDALRETDGSVAEAAALLGVTRQSAWARTRANPRIEALRRELLVVQGERLGDALLRIAHGVADEDGPRPELQHQLKALEIALRHGPAGRAAGWAPKVEVEHTGRVGVSLERVSDEMLRELLEGDEDSDD